jgi:hypothetical protein
MLLLIRCHKTFGKVQLIDNYLAFASGPMLSHFGFLGPRRKNDWRSELLRKAVLASMFVGTQ